MPDCVVGLMTKFPRKGKVKTRLAKDIGDDLALKVYEKLLNNAVEVLRTLPKNKISTAILVEPPNYRDQFKKKYPCIKYYLPQKGEDLGNRMYQALQELMAIDNITKAILIGADIPEIDNAVISKAEKALQINDLVLGPTHDGGYYLIGLKRLHPDLFTGLDWSTDKVYDQTIDVARRLKMKTVSLHTLSDLDDYSDLKQFQEYFSLVDKK